MGPLKNKHAAAKHWAPLRGLLFCLPLLCVAQPKPETAPMAAVYAQAEQAIAAGDYPLAEQLLQQVIQQNPEWAGAWLDLALLAVRQAQYAQAEEFLLVLVARFAPLPAPMAQAVGQLQSQIRQHIKQQATTELAGVQRIRQNIVAVATGYETNANAGLQFSTLTLNLPDGDAIVNIDPSSQARSARYVRATLAHSGQEALGQGSLNWQVQSQARQYSLSQLNNIEWLAQVSLEQAPLPGRFMLGWQAIWLGSQAIYQTPVMRWQFDLPVGDSCGLQQHVQSEARQHPQASHLNARWQAYRASWRCQAASSRSQFYGQVATENADTDKRPGGNSLHRSVGLQHEWLRAFGLQDHSILARVDVLSTQDSATYSPLLAKGQARQLRRTEGQLTWSGPLASSGPWRWSVGAQVTRQRSNIQFFNQANNALETSIWRAW